MNKILPSLGDTRTEIKKYLTSKGIKQSWLSSNLGIHKARMSEILNCNEPLPDDMKKRINELLNTNF